MSELDMQNSISKFVCQRCGSCCKGNGVVHLNDAEIAPIAQVLGLIPEEFLDQYTVLTGWGERWLTDKQVNGQTWCVFLERAKGALHACRIQKAKPDQCASFPFSWRPVDAGQWCKGLGAQT